jgi:hypothetical protein
VPIGPGPCRDAVTVGPPKAVHLLKCHDQRDPLLLDTAMAGPGRCDELVLQAAFGLGQVLHRPSGRGPSGLPYWSRLVPNRSQDS